MSGGDTLQVFQRCISIAHVVFRAIIQSGCGDALICKYQLNYIYIYTQICPFDI